MKIKHQGEARDFSIVIGLEEGYEGKITHTREKVMEIISGWLVDQKNSGGIYIPGMLSPEYDMVYYSRTQKRVLTEPIVKYEGHVSPEYNAEVSDEEIVHTLIFLATLIANTINQTRMYLSYRGRLMILEK